MMPDPASALADLQRLADVPCPEWQDDLACRGVELDCAGVAAGQAALREALAAGGTHHDVLARVRNAVASSRLPAKRQRTAMAVVEVAREAARRNLAAAFVQFAGHGAPGTAAF